LPIDLALDVHQMLNDGITDERDFFTTECFTFRKSGKVMIDNGKLFPTGCRASTFYMDRPQVRTGTDVRSAYATNSTHYQSQNATSRRTPR
jgi:hypothetical protein